MADSMPSQYDTQPQAGDGGGGERGAAINLEHIKSPNGILKIIQAALSLITFICAAVGYQWHGVGGGWVMFVSILSFVLVTVLFFLYLSDVIYKIPGPFQFMQICYYAGTSLLYFIAAVVASARSTQSWAWWGRDGSVKATAVFCWFSLIAFVVHLVLQLVEYRRMGMPGFPGRGSTQGSQQQSTEVEAGKTQY